MVPLLKLQLTSECKEAHFPYLRLKKLLSLIYCTKSTILFSFSWVSHFIGVAQIHTICEYFITIAQYFSINLRIGKFAKIAFGKTFSGELLFGESWSAKKESQLLANLDTTCFMFILLFRGTIGTSRLQDKTLNIQQVGITVRSQPLHM